MYGFSKPDAKYISLDSILERVSQEEIFSIVFGFIPIEYEYVTSPFRNDSSPGAFFEYKGDTLYFVDFGDSKHTHYGCVLAVSEFYGLSFKQALNYIDDYFKLGLGSGVNVKPVDKTVRTITRIKEKHPIEFASKPYYQQDQDYWSQYGITIPQLKEDGVFSVRWYKVFSQKKQRFVTIRPQEPTYAITKIKGVKIYTPTGKVKWVSSVDNNAIGNIDNIDKEGTHLIITKSYKDHRVLRNYGNKNVVWFQSENQIPDEEILLNLVEGFQRVTILYDNDKPGIQGGNNLEYIINGYYPEKAKLVVLATQEKDPSDLYLANKENLQDYLNKWELNNIN